MVGHIFGRENGTLLEQDGLHAWSMVRDVLTHRPLEPSADAIPYALAVPRRAKFPEDTEAERGTCVATVADDQAASPRREVLTQLREEVHRLA